MKLIHKTVQSYLDDLASESPAPGGGSVSALAGAQAMALVCMVCNLTVENPKYAASALLCKEALLEAQTLQSELREAFDQDTQAFYLVADAYKLPKATEEEKAARSAAIAAGTLEATKVPYRVMQLSCRGLELLSKLDGMTNKNADSDRKVAALNLEAAVKGAWFNVLINLPGLKDPVLQQEFEHSGRAILETCNALMASLSME